jgi:thiamine pyrophosphate-dependent acetolactate synthase large subunit-like protein
VVRRRWCAAIGATEALAPAEHLDASVFHNINAKGILPPGHHLRAGENMAFAQIHDAIAAADAVLAVGSEFGETCIPIPCRSPFPTGSFASTLTPSSWLIDADR